MPNQAVHSQRAPLLGEHRKGILTRFAQLLFQITVTGALLFLCAGSVGWRPGWLSLAVTLASIAGTAVWVLPRNQAYAQRTRYRLLPGVW